MLTKVVDGVAVEMTAEEEAQVLAEWAAADAKAATAAMTALLAKFRADRLAMLAVVSGMGWAALTEGDTATSQTLATFRQGLLDLPQLPSVKTATDVSSLSASMAVAYKALTDALPAEIKANFKALL